MENKPKISALICIDPARCLWKKVDNKTPLDILWELKQAFDSSENVNVTACKCIFGCTYGPRMDIINHETKEKTIYGSIDGEVEISVRGVVNMNKIPNNLQDLLPRPNISKDLG